MPCAAPVDDGRFCAAAVTDLQLARRRPQCPSVQEIATLHDCSSMPLRNIAFQTVAERGCGGPAIADALPRCAKGFVVTIWRCTPWASRWCSASPSRQPDQHSRQGRCLPAERKIDDTVLTGMRILPEHVPDVAPDRDRGGLRHRRRRGWPRRSAKSKIPEDFRRTEGRCQKTRDFVATSAGAVQRYGAENRTTSISPSPARPAEFCWAALSRTRFCVAQLSTSTPPRRVPTRCATPVPLGKRDFIGAA